MLRLVATHVLVGIATIAIIGLWCVATGAEALVEKLGKQGSREAHV